MINYFVEGEYLDTFEGGEFAVSKQISKIGELDLRHGDVSTNFKVPLTAKNARILRYTPQINAFLTVDNFDRYDGHLEEDGVTISSGYYQVLKFSPTSKKVELRFFGANADWFDQLKNRFINQEDGAYNLDDLKHKFNYAGVTGSFGNTDGYFYYLHSNGRDDVKGKGQGNMTVDAFNVGVYSKTIFSKIFNSVGIQTKGTLFDSPTFQQEIVSGIKPLSKFKSRDYYRGFKTNGGVEIPADGSYVPLGFTTGNQDSQWDGGTLTLGSDATNVGASFMLFVDRDDSPTVPTSDYGDIVFRVKKNGLTIYNPTLTVQFQQGIAFKDRTLVRFAKISFIDNSPTVGDVYEFELANINNITGDASNWATNKGALYAESFLNVGFGNAINDYDITTVLPKIKQTDFIKDIMVRHGVVSQYDPIAKVLTLDKLEKVSDRKATGEDWSNKIDLSKEINVDFSKLLSGYAKSSVFTYTDDTEKDSYLSLLKASLEYPLGDGVLDIENDFLTDEKVVYKSPFSATAQAIVGDSEVYVPRLPTWELTGEDDLGNPEYNENELKPRILLALPDTPIVDINKTAETEVGIENDNGTPQDFTEVGYAFFSKVQADRLELNNDNLDLNAGSLNFSNYDLKIDVTEITGGVANSFVGSTLFDESYELYNKILNNPFYVSMYMNLTSQDVAEVDFLTPVFLDYKYDKGYYYIDSIEQYKGDGSTTKVNFIKLV